MLTNGKVNENITKVFRNEDILLKRLSFKLILKAEYAKKIKTCMPIVAIIAIHASPDKTIFATQCISKQLLQ